MMTRFDVEHGFHEALFENSQTAAALAEIDLGPNMRGNLMGLFCENAIVAAIQSAPDSVQDRFRAGAAMGTVRLDKAEKPAGEQREKFKFQTDEILRILAMTSDDTDARKAMLLNFHEWTMKVLISGRIADGDGSVGVMGAASLTNRLQRAWNQSDKYIEDLTSISETTRARVADYDIQMDRMNLDTDEVRRADVVDRHVKAAIEGPARDAALAALGGGGVMAAQNALIMAVGEIFAS